MSLGRNLGKIAIAATSFACMTLFTAGWSGAQAENAQAQAKHPQASKHMAAKPMAAKHMAAKPMAAKHVAAKPMAAKHVAASPRPHGQRVVRRGYGPNPVAAGADLAGGAVNTAGAVAAGAVGTAGAIAAAPFGGSYAAAPGWDSGGYYSASTWGDHDCRPGFAGCRPYVSKDWGNH